MLDQQELQADSCMSGTSACFCGADGVGIPDCIECILRTYKNAAHRLCLRGCFCCVVIAVQLS